MKKFSLALAVLLCALWMAGCAPASVVEGKWADAAGNTYTFTSKGTYTIDTGDDIVVGGTYTINQEASTIETTLTVTPGNTVTKGASFAYDKDQKTLTLTEQDGTQTVLTKSK